MNPGLLYPVLYAAKIFWLFFLKLIETEETFTTMPTDDAVVYQLVHAIGNLAHKLPDHGSSINSAERAKLVRDAERLAIAAREPAENLYFQATQV